MAFLMMSAAEPLHRRVDRRVLRGDRARWFEEVTSGVGLRRPMRVST